MNSMSKVLVEKAIVAQQLPNSHYMEPGSRLSQKPATGPYLDTVEFRLQSDYFILLSEIKVGLSNQTDSLCVCVSVCPQLLTFETIGEFS
jgi:hypothetical protein